ncbi:uncharacterized protein BDZ83DRAFT_629362 [Colletotrichum acutatum]|uniref:Secreted protein n=1 Tax=Glomerella acutata TaxID=27357 RepID=A0AAD8UDT2_GLOAC|nr:uncharacterized protein BDZ83DRAFT_629362 [Colletotrichum acutatum]KAK1722312.1 hypothetical protein BDZ83DRAFT_629362 [Colletotrichum acutatum]
MISFFASVSFLLPQTYIFCLLLVRAQNHPIDRNMTRLIKVQHTIRRHCQRPYHATPHCMSPCLRFENRQTTHGRSRWAGGEIVFEQLNTVSSCLPY